MKPYWDIMWLRVCDNCDGMLQEVREDSKSRLDLVDTCEICDYDVCNSCRQQIADSLSIQVEGCDPDGACCKAARCLDPEDASRRAACSPDCPVVCLRRASRYSSSDRTWWLREGHRAAACVPRGLGPDMLAARRAQKQWVHRNLFPALPHENIWDPRCGGDADDSDSDWESDHEPSDEQVAWMERG